jgi:hypothetical protein
VRFRAVDGLPDRHARGVTELAPPATGTLNDSGEGPLAGWVEVVQPGPLTTLQDLG